MSIRKINPRARALRQTTTDAEQRMWHDLRGRRLEGHKFKRQWSIGHYVVDFCCIDRKLVVEIDGGQHTIDGDAQRTNFLNAAGYRVIRFWNNDVLQNTDGVLIVLAEQLLSDPHPVPLPRAGEGAR